MALPTDVKHALVERFTPLLYVSLTEPDLPVDPTAYVESAALWSSKPPRHDKPLWGLPAGADRQPLVERHGISLDPAHDVHGTSDPDGDGVPEHYLGEEDDQGRNPLLDPPGREPWLDVVGWQDGELVTPATLNKRTEPGPRPPLEQPWFSADVWTVGDLVEQIGSEGMEARFGLGYDDVAPALEGAVVIAFHFLFPLHREHRRTTALDPKDDPYSGEYEGDWATFAVIARASVPPGRISSPDEVTPAYAGYGHRWRGVDDDHEDGATERMFLRKWDDVLAVDEHPVVVAAPGTHNLYPHDPPLTPAGTVKPQFIEWGKGLSEPANAIPRDATEEPYSAVLALKIIAGFALAGPVGLLVGALAAGAEAVWAEEEGLMEPPKLQAHPPPESDNPLADDWEDLQTKSVAVPPGIAAPPPLIDPAQSKVHEWKVTPDQSLVDGSILFEPSGGLPAYNGRWGVRCTADPFLRRSGIKLPAHRALVIDALLTQA